MLQERTIYRPTPTAKPTETPIKPPVKVKRRSLYITAETVKNKLLGASLIGLGMLSAVLTGDGTAAVMMFFLALSAIVSK